MKAVKIRNKTNRMMVVQLPRECTGLALKSKSETVMRYTEGRDGSIRPAKVRLRHGPVLRLCKGEVSDLCSIEVLRNDTIKRLRKEGKIEVEYVDLPEKEKAAPEPKKNEVKADPEPKQEQVSPTPQKRKTHSKKKKGLSKE